MKDDLKISEIEYLITWWSDHNLQWKMTSNYKKWNILVSTSSVLPEFETYAFLTKLLNFKNTSTTEDDLKMIKVEYLSNHWLDLTQILS